MATKQVFIPLGVSQANDVAKELISPGSVLLAENAVSDYVGRWVRRYGATRFATSATLTHPAGGALPKPWRVGELGTSLVRFNEDPAPLHVWADETEAWVRPFSSAIKSDRIGPKSVRTEPVFMGTSAGEQTENPDVAIGSGYVVSTYEYSSAALGAIVGVVVIKDEQTNVTVYRRTLAGGTRRLRPIVIGTRALVVYDDNGTIRVDAYSLTPPALADTVTLTTCTPGTPIAVRSGSYANVGDISILYRDAAGLLRVGIVRASTLATNSNYEAQNTGGTMAQPNLAFNWIKDIGASGRISAVVCNTTDGLVGLWNLPAPTAGVSNAVETHVLDAGATSAPAAAVPGVRNIVAATVNSVTTGNYRVLYEVTAPDVVTRPVIKMAIWTGASAVSTPYRGVGIRSELWLNSTNLYFWATWADEDQETYLALAMPYTTSASGTTTCVQAVCLPRSGGGLTERVQCPSQIATDADGAYVAAFTTILRVESVASSLVAVGAEARVKGIVTATLKHRTAPDTQTGALSSMIDSLFVPDAAFGFFDGQTYGLAGFAWYPPQALGGSQAGGNLEPSSNYVWAACYAFVDNGGRKWRSRPSVLSRLATTGTDFQFDMEVETLRCVDRDQYQIELYRSQADAPDQLFLVAAVPNDPTAQSVTIRDNVADEDLGEELYTDGGTRANDLLPPISHAAMYEGRMVCASGGTLWYTPQIDLAHGLTFSPSLTFDVVDPADPITGMAATDAYLVVFKKGRSYLIAGSMANALGQGQTLEARLIEGGIGTENATSIAVDADGAVWCRSTSDRAGFFRITGSQAQYVGQGVRDYVGLAITGAVVETKASEIRFFSNPGTAQVYNWVSQTWSLDTGRGADAACSWRGRAMYANGSNDFYRLDPDAVLEGAAGYNMKIRSPWYSGAGMENWERVRRFTGAGTPIAAHRVVARLYRDFDAGTPIGTAEATYVGTETRWAWYIRPRVQKVTAYMLEIEIFPHPTGPTYTRGPAVLGVTLEVEVKRGSRKLAAGSRLVNT